MKCCRKSFISALLKKNSTCIFAKAGKRLIRSLKSFFLKSGLKEDDIEIDGCRLLIKKLSPLELRKKYIERFKLFAEGGTCSNHCQIAFLQGMFFAFGYVQNPGKGYHLEVRTYGKWLPAAFAKTTRFLKIRFGRYRKGKYQIFYLKSYRRIIRFFNILGLFNKALEFSDFTATKGLLSIVNRQVNSETANINRLVSAAEKSINNIQQLMSYPKQDFWTESLLQMALMRLRFPSDSIEKLGTRFEPALSKSAVNHRLRRINALYKKLFPAQNEETEDQE
ncbi:MAG: DNA-binding protein WhiA [Candidatus Rifleibacteriota bacterium]